MTEFTDESRRAILPTATLPRWSVILQPSEPGD